MRFHRQTYHIIGILLAQMLFALPSCAQEVKKGAPVPQARLHRESNLRQLSDSVAVDTVSAERVPAEGEADVVRVEEGDTLSVTVDSARMKFILTPDSLRAWNAPDLSKHFMPDPKKALWLAIVFPGGGQIYNRKYWKLPLVYGGFLGCMYAMNWNNTMYRDYSQAYIDIMDSDENTKSYENFIPPTYDVNANLTRLQDLFKRKKNYYRRYRDLSLFCMIGVYALSIIDAYVDAELSSFDISDDLSMKIHPTVIHDKHSVARAQGMGTPSYGLQCSVFF